jgi:hypothetical protein
MNRNQHEKPASIESTATSRSVSSALGSGAVAIAAVASVLMTQVASATPTSSSYDISFIATSAPAAGDVVEIAGAVFTAVGTFGAQSIVRIDGGGETILADGFGALGGFAYDAVNDRLLVGDNFLGGSTGDTLYEIPNPFGSPASPAAALGLELLAAGSIPGLADLILDPNDPTGDTLFVTDASASFPPFGVVLQVVLSTQVVTTIQTGLEFSAGLATDGTSLFIGNSLLAGGADLSSVPVGSPTDLPGSIGSYAGGLFDAEYAPDGSLLISSGDSILRVDPITGSSTVIASGFGFAAGLFAADDGTIYAIDGFAAVGEENRVWVLSQIPEPGTGLLLGCGISVLALRRGARRSLNPVPAA